VEFVTRHSLKMNITFVVLILFINSWFVIGTTIYNGTSVKYNTYGYSVSGLSAGGYMAVQFHVSHSSSIVGSAATAAGPYWCAQNNAFLAQTACMTSPLQINIPTLISATTFAQNTGSIDNVANLRNSRVYLFSGSRDSAVVPGVVRKLQDYYSNYVTGSNIKTEYSIGAEHAIVTNDWGNPCATLRTPYINNCGFDYAGESLKWIYGSLNAPKVPNGNIIQIDQGMYTPSPSAISMDRYAYAYIPTGCQGGENCRLHVSFHGCNQGSSVVGLDYVQYGGYNKWAEANNIIILYPQAKASNIPLNPNGCWDWWGYTGADYATKWAPQVSTVKRMMDGL